MGIYSNLEDKWYALLEKIDRVLPILWLVDKVDKVLPSFIVFLVIVIILLALGVGIFFNFETTYAAEITVLGPGNIPIEGALIEFDSGCMFGESSAVTDEFGKAIFSICSETITLNVSKENYKTKRETITLKDGKAVLNLLLSGQEKRTVTVLVFDKGNEIIRGSELTMICLDTLESRTFTSQGDLGFNFKTFDCSSIQLRASAHGFEEKTVSLLVNEERKQIYLEKIDLLGKAIFETTDPLGSVQAEITLTSKNNELVRTVYTNQSGSISLDLEEGDYSYSALYGGEIIEGEFALVREGIEFIEITFSEVYDLDDPEIDKVASFIKLKIEDTLGSAIQNATVNIYKSGDQIATRDTKGDGKISELTIRKDNFNTTDTFIGIVQATGYTTKRFEIELKKKNDAEQIVKLEQGGAELKVNLIDDIEKVVKNGVVLLKIEGTTETIDQGISSSSGTALFKNLPSGKYIVSAKGPSGDSEGKAEIILENDSSKEVTIQLFLGTGRIKFNFYNPYKGKEDAEYSFYEEDNGTLQLRLGGITTRGYFNTPEIKNNSKIKMEITDSNFFYHEDFTYRVSRDNQERDLFIRKIGDLPNTEEVQMFFIQAYNTNPLYGNSQIASSINPGQKYYFYISTIINNVENGLLTNNFYIEGEHVTIENAYSIDGYATKLSENLQGFSITENLVSSGAKQANVLLNEQQGKKSVPIIVEIQADQNFDGSFQLFFQNTHKNAKSLLYSKEFISGESFCTLECPTFLFSNYIKWGERDFVPTGNYYTLLIGDNYTLKTNVKNLGDEDFRDISLVIEVPKEKLQYINIEGGKDSNVLFDLLPLNSTEGEFSLNPLKATAVATITERVYKEENGNNALKLFEGYESTIPLGIKTKSELEISISPSQITENSEYPLFVVKTKYKSEYKGTPAYWYVEKVDSSGGKHLLAQGETDVNGIDLTSFDALNLVNGDKVLFTTYDDFGSIEGTLEIEIIKHLPDPAINPLECLRIEINSKELSEYDNPNIPLSKDSTGDFKIISSCEETRFLYIHSDLPVSLKQFEISAGEERIISVTANPRGDLLGAYPIQVLTFLSQDPYYLGLLDIVISDPNSCFDLADAILDFRSIEDIETKITNTCYDGRLDAYYPKITLNTNTYALDYERSEAPENLNFKVVVDGYALESFTDSYTKTDQISIGSKGLRSDSRIGYAIETVVIESASVANDYGFSEMAEKYVWVADMNVDHSEPDLPETDPTIPFYELPQDIQNQIISQLTEAQTITVSPKEEKKQSFSNASSVNAINTFSDSGESLFFATAEEDCITCATTPRNLKYVSDCKAGAAGYCKGDQSCLNEWYANCDAQLANCKPICDYTCASADTCDDLSYCATCVTTYCSDKCSSFPAPIPAITPLPSTAAYDPQITSGTISGNDANYGTDSEGNTFFVKNYGMENEYFQSLFNRIDLTASGAQRAYTDTDGTRQYYYLDDTGTWQTITDATINEALEENNLLVLNEEGELTYEDSEAAGQCAGESISNDTTAPTPTGAYNQNTPLANRLMSEGDSGTISVTSETSYCNVMQMSPVYGCNVAPAMPAYKYNRTQDGSYFEFFYSVMHDSAGNAADSLGHSDLEEAGQEGIVECEKFDTYANYKAITLDGYVEAISFGSAGFGDASGEALDCTGPRIYGNFKVGANGTGLGNILLQTDQIVSEEIIQGRHERWEQDFNLSPEEGKVYDLGPHGIALFPTWTGVTSLGEKSIGDTWSGGEESPYNASYYSVTNILGNGFVNWEYIANSDCTWGEGMETLASADEADPLIEYSPTGKKIYKLDPANIPNGMRMFLKNGHIYAEYIGSAKADGPEIPFKIEKINSQGSEYAHITVYDWINGTDKNGQTFQVKLVDYTTECIAGDGTVGFTGEALTPKLLFDWDWNSINYNQCDMNNANYTYCDAAQFTISLFKRLQKIEGMLKRGEVTSVPNETTFYAYMIKDNYTKEFLEDFDYYYSNEFLGTPTYYHSSNNSPGMDQFIRENKLNFEIKDDTRNGAFLEYGGLYRVELAINFDNENIQSLFSVDQTNSSITVTLVPVQKAPNSNPFYETPFDGEIGKKGNENTRNNYGVSIDGGLALNELVTTENYASPMTTINYTTATNLTTLDNKIVLLYDSISNTLRFNPSQPTPVLMTITGEGVVNADYKVEGTLAQTAPAKTWKLANSTIGDSSCHDFEDNEKYFFTESNLSGGNKRLAWNGTKSGEIGLSTVFLTPNNPEEVIVLTPINEDVVALSSYSELINGSSIMLNNYYSKGITNYDTIKGIFELVKDEKMCVSKSAEQEMKIWWNQDYLDALKEEINNSDNRCN